LVIRRSLFNAFPPLAVANYRRYAGFNFLGNIATWMQRVAVDWVVLEVSGSPIAVGVAVFLQFGPLLVFGLLGGAIVDRFPRFRVLVVTQTCSAVLAISLGVLQLCGLATLPVLLGACALLGCITVVDNPARHAIVGDLVGDHLLTPAISLNASLFQIGRLIGPTTSGIALATVGAGWSFVGNGIACAALAYGLMTLRRDQLFRPEVRPHRSRIGAGLSAVIESPPVLWSVVLVAIVSLSALNLPVLLTSLTQRTFSSGAFGYGLLTSLCAVGALIGALVVARWPTVGFDRVVAAAAALGLVQALAGVSSPIWAAVCLAGVGFLSQTFLTASNALVQRACAADVRGRVMAVYLTVLLGGQSLGGLLSGLAVDAFGARAAFVLSGVLPLCGAAVVSVVASSGTIRRRRASRFEGQATDRVDRR
jgi:MFS family permease